MPFNNFPYTNLNDLNLDWILKKIKSLRKDVDQLKEAEDDPGTTTRKKILIIGDSWSSGWNGSTNVQSWPTVFARELGLANDEYDLIRQNGGGFSVRSTTGSYPNEIYSTAILHNAGTDYRAIVVQTGWNDIKAAESLTYLKTTIGAFKTNASTFWPGIPVYAFFTWPNSFVPYDRQDYAELLVKECANQGFIVAADSLNWLLGMDGLQGTDAAHLNVAGYEQIGKLAAAFFQGWDGHKPDNTITYLNGTEPSIIPFAFNDNVTTTSFMYARIRNGTVYVTGVIRFKESGLPSSGNVVIGTGMPQPIVNGTLIPAFPRVVGKPAVRLYITPAGELQAVLTGDSNDAVYDFYGNYGTCKNIR